MALRGVRSVLSGTLTGGGGLSNNPFDDVDYMETGIGQNPSSFAPIRSINSPTGAISGMGFNDEGSASNNPFDDLEILSMQPIQPTIQQSKSPITTATSPQSKQTGQGKKLLNRIGSKESALKMRSAVSPPTIDQIMSSSNESSDSEEEEEEDDDDDDDDYASAMLPSKKNGEYGPDALADNANLSGRNRALVFMEQDAPQKCECRLLIKDEGTRFEFMYRDKCWMKAQKRTDGINRIAPALNVSLWVDPVLLVAHHQGRHEEDENTDVSFADVIRELEYAEEMEEDVATKRDSLLRVGKIKGNSRQTRFQVFGTGKSHNKAMGAMDARPEFMAIKFEKGGSVVGLPGQPKKGGTKTSRPTKSKDFLLNRMESGHGDPIRQLTGVKGTNVWQFHENGDVMGAPGIRITRKNVEEMICEFKGASPAVVFALAIIIHFKGTSLLTSGQSWSSLLPKRNSFIARKGSKLDVTGIM